MSQHCSRARFVFNWKNKFVKFRFKAKLWVSRPNLWNSRSLFKTKLWYLKTRLQNWIFQAKFIQDKVAVFQDKIAKLNIQLNIHRSKAKLKEIFEEMETKCWQKQLDAQDVISQGTVCLNNKYQVLWENWKRVWSREKGAGTSNQWFIGNNREPKTGIRICLITKQVLCSYLISWNWYLHSIVLFFSISHLSSLFVAFHTSYVQFNNYNCNQQTPVILEAKTSFTFQFHKKC